MDENKVAGERWGTIGMNDKREMNSPDVVDCSYLIKVAKHIGIKIFYG